MFDLTLAAVSVHRRTAALGIFRKAHLEEMFTRQFPSDLSKAENAVLGFIRQALERNKVGLVAFELDANSDRILLLRRAAMEAVRAEGIPIREVETESLNRTFAIPPLRNRDQLRKVTQSIWPQLDNRDFGRAALDAVALGLCVQMERLFVLNSPQS